jgi:hypothetical protein
VAQFLGASPDDEAYEDLEYYYPTVSRAAGHDALDFHREVSAAGRRAAN